ncbi:ABC transporter permease [Corynebacterium sp. 153RC1]|uniref:FtsX-like permease family protein n=1 Tax=unclassified Corynebacterium TaxID=2624378 RepID=UPI00211BE280|nr:MULTISPECIES: ABC transporter permease [unclassified Corynebacterium]MCQ9370080.1 ABC transporter permease [Corynebacterium sp. 35RC1]MCQ9351854.1 ABC transporter permease [Corynebacterium sp. 209RC1]MCQ9355011.1 ABC transporter permease [Corynebacterium sp. 1222RC1]MCQ9356136.1 ABC transporter permease [Corynebacterium sp. 122RC1]MCQ9359531.1 ABC transporter permease [Corynebacterium sp. 142RC1]
MDAGTGAGNSTALRTRPRSGGNTVRAIPALLRIAGKNIHSHKARFLLSLLAVAIGAAFLAGTVVLTSSIQSTLNTLVSNEYQNTDSIVRQQRGIIGTSAEQRLEATEQLESSNLGLSVLLTSDQRIPISLLEPIRQNPEVAAINIDTAYSMTVTDAQGNNPFQFRPPTLSTFYGTEEIVGNKYQVIEGRAPEQHAPEAVISDTMAKEGNLSVGNTIHVTHPYFSADLLITGIFQDVQTQSTLLGGTRDVLAPTETSQIRVSEGTFIHTFTDGQFVGSMKLNGRTMHGAELASYLRTTFPEAQFLDAPTLAAQLEGTISTTITFLRMLLTAFALIALVICAFVISNTFGVVAAQRIEEFSLLRSIGVQRKQLLSLVLLEASALGLLGSALGTAVGIASGWAGVKWIGTTAVSPAPPAFSVPVEAISLPVVVGACVTVLAALRAGLRASKVRPLEALRQSEQLTSRPTHLRTILGLALLAVSGVLIVFPLPHTYALVTGGAAAVLCILSVFLITPAVLVLIGTLLAPPKTTASHRKKRASSGRTLRQMAAQSMIRTPRRSAATSFAFALGVSLVIASQVLSTAANRLMTDEVRQEITAAVSIQSSADGSFEVPAESIEALGTSPEVAQMLTMSVAPVQVAQKTQGTLPVTTVMNQDPANFIALEGVSGSTDLSQPNTFIADAATAAANGWSIGAQVPLLGALGDQYHNLTLIGIYSSSNTMGSLVISTSSLEDLPYGPTRNLTSYFLNPIPDVPAAQLLTTARAELSEYPLLRVGLGQDFTSSQAQLFNQVLLLVNVLVALALVVAVLGVANTLVLSVLVRRHEYALLRAIGLLSTQIRALIQREALFLAAIGAAAGITLGLVISGIVLSRLAPDTVRATLDTALLCKVAAVGAGAVLIGWITALTPARVAARTSPLEAI